MAKNKDMTAEDIFAIVSSYMNAENVTFIKKHMKLLNLHTRDNLEVQAKHILSTLFKLQAFLLSYKWIRRLLLLDFFMTS